MNRTNDHEPNQDRRACIEKLAAQLAQLLAAAGTDERQALEAAFAAAVQQALARVNPETELLLQCLKSPPLTPEIRDWLRQQFSEEEIAAWLQESREQGGVELCEFLPELEQIVGQP